MDMIATSHVFAGAFRPGGADLDAVRGGAASVGLLLEALGGYCSGVRAEPGQLLP